MEAQLTTEAYDTLSERVRAMHDALAATSPEIDRIACAVYDPVDDTLKTFLNSTRDGKALRAYQYRLADSESLSYLARTRELRLLTDVQNQLAPTTAHSRYVLEEGYRSSFTVPLYHQDEFLGFVFFDSRASDTFTGPVQRELVLYAGLLAMAIVNERVAVRTIVGTIQVARDVTALHDAETASHLDRMARYSRLLTQRLVEPMNLSDEFVEAVMLYAPLHDIGKIAIPDAILQKPGPLTPEERLVVQSHTTKGRQMIETITADLGLDRLPNRDVMCNVVELHHEAMNGSGYPHGLTGDDIPLEARIVSVADVYDALTTVRPYKQAWSQDEAFVELWSMVERGKLDETVVATFDALRAEARAIAAEFSDD